jgi:hypothetical protein
MTRVRVASRFTVHQSVTAGHNQSPFVTVWKQALEGAEDCLLASSGMNSATTMLLALVPAGGHIVTTTDCYRRTRQFIQTVHRCKTVARPCMTLTVHSGLDRLVSCHSIPNSIMLLLADHGFPCLIIQDFDVER